MTLVYGLTGGIGSGKSEVVRVLRGSRHRLPVVDADEIAREVVRPGTLAHALIRLRFGRQYLRADASTGRAAIDRAKLGALVFADARARRALNRITHPFVVVRVLAQLARHALLLRTPLVVLDVPLLYESRLACLCSLVLVVHCTEAQQCERVRRRNPALGEAEVQRRVRAQMPLARKVERADVCIDNRGELRDLDARVAAALDVAAKTVQQRALAWNRKAGLVGAVVCALLLAAALALGRYFPSTATATATA